jgi:DNA-binding NtrC family response regulator
VPDSEFVLVADDPRLGCALQARLQRPAPLHPFATVRQHLDPEAGGVLVCAAASPAGAEQAARLLQEVRLQQWPYAVVAIAAGAARACPLERLDPFVNGCLRWPEEADRLEDLLRAAQGAAAPAPADGGRRPADPGAALARRLLQQTPSLRPLAETLARAFAHAVPVLLTGESGVGKAHLARLIHQHSPRREHRFLVVPCGALDPGALGAGLFGHARGPSAGAGRPGPFEAAAEGTVLLDGIDALGLGQQAELLRVLRTGRSGPAGSTPTRVCQPRLIAASNADLGRAMVRGRFRRDLYSCLSGLALHLPPLRERVGDIAPLARAMAARFSGQFGKGLFGVAAEALAALEALLWPGNARQLEHVVQQAVLASSGPVLLPEHLPPLVRGRAPAAPRRPTSGRSD